MKFCIDFHKELNNSQYDEVNINFDRIQSEQALSDYCEEHPNQRINVFFDNLEKCIENKTLEKMLDYQEKNTYNIYIRIPETNSYTDELIKKYPKTKYFVNLKINN